MTVAEDRGAIPVSWVHPSWVARLGGAGAGARRSLSTMLADPRMRPVARKLAERHRVDLLLESHDLIALDAPVLAAIDVLAHDAEGFVLLLGHVALRGRIRECLVADGVPADLDRTLSRRALTATVDAIDALERPPTEEVWIEGCRMLATWLDARSGAARAFLRLALPVETFDSLEGMKRRRDAEAAVSVVDALFVAGADGAEGQETDDG